MAYKLVISSTLEFPVRFTVRDGAKDRTFAYKLRCQRTDVEAFRRSMQESSETLGDLLRSFLASPALGLQMVEWIGEPLLVDEAGVPAPAGAEAFAFLLTLDGMLQHVFAAVADASSAKGKLGN
ncbi:MAG TPA: hypothetical protein PLW24_01960 [Burkholderiaceae bacterium]|nr:hypothetical protein [Burkholderiaceae bacterium]HNB42707.1 hypothetical protein [Burkholderiaceae bacterium]HNG78207.1 hypothetical protein [Burkholderiaceae bacterium]